MKKLSLKKEIVAQLANRQNMRGGAVIQPVSEACTVIHTDNTYCNCVTLYADRCEDIPTQACGGGNDTRNCPTAGCPPIFSQTCISVDRCPVTENNCGIEIKP